MKENIWTEISKYGFSKVGVIHYLAAVTFFSQLPSFFGEDIVNARSNYLTGSRTDFWGGVSTLVYAHVPDFGIRWQVILALIQIVLTAVGLQILLPTRRNSKWVNVGRWALTYSALLFGSQMTRDGLMFSILLFGFATLKISCQANHPKKVMLGPLLVICFAMSFRPWLALAVVPVIVIFFRGSGIKLTRAMYLALSVTIAVTPVAIEVGTVKVLKLNKSFPQQQVMLMDIAATFCYTNNYETGIKAGEALNFFTTDLNYQKYACQLYRPDTWVSLTQALNASSAGLEVDFSLIQPNNEKAYTSLKDKWLNIVLSDPVTYLQNKLSFGNKLLIGSDTRALSVFSAQTFSEMVMSIYRLPFDIAISLHLFSLFACISMFILFSLVHMIKKRDSSFILKEDALMLITSMLIWSALSSIAYIGSNGRYTYAITMVSSIIYLSCSSWKSDTEKKHG